MPPSAPYRNVTSAIRPVRPRSEAGARIAYSPGRDGHTQTDTFGGCVHGRAAERGPDVFRELRGSPLPPLFRRVRAGQRLVAGGGGAACLRGPELRRGAVPGGQPAGGEVLPRREHPVLRRPQRRLRTRRVQRLGYARAGGQQRLRRPGRLDGQPELRHRALRTRRTGTQGLQRGPEGDLGTPRGG